MNEHVEETPEMAKLRKAKSSLKGAQANISEICKANDAMSERMLIVADTLERYARSIGDGVYLYGYFSAGSASHVKLKELLEHEAKALREKAV